MIRWAAYALATALLLAAAPCSSASAASCDQEGSSPAAQERAMRCMIDSARERSGLNPLADSSVLDHSARRKTADVLRCDSFSHEACGREFAYWMRRVGYLSAPCWRVAENLAWGTGEGGTVRSIFRTWMHSPEHRRNILGDYKQIGLDVAVGTLEGRAATHVWTTHFGSRCEGHS